MTFFSFYQDHFQKSLSEAELQTLKILVWLLQVQKQVRIERRFSLFSPPHSLRESPQAYSKIFVVAQAQHFSVLATANQVDYSDRILSKQSLNYFP